MEQPLHANREYTGTGEPGPTKPILGPAILSFTTMNLWNEMSETGISIERVGPRSSFIYPWPIRFHQRNPGRIKVKIRESGGIRTFPSLFRNGQISAPVYKIATCEMNPNRAYEAEPS